MSFTNFKETIEEGDTVILYIGVSQIYALKVQPKVPNRHGVLVEYTFQSKYGALNVMDLVGKKYGSRVTLSKGYAYVLFPTAELWTMTLPHRTQILYTPDISIVITELNISCGSIVCEAGTGSGSLSHAILRAIGPTGHLYTSDFHQERVEAVKKEFEEHGFNSRVTVQRQDVCCSGWGVMDVADAVFLDLPKPWEALPHAIKAIKPNGGRVCSFSPCIEQVSRTCECMVSFGLTEIKTIENIQREFQLRMMSLPPVSVKTMPVKEIMTKIAKEKIAKKESKKQKRSNADGEMPLSTSEDVEEEASEMLEVGEPSPARHSSIPASYSLSEFKFQTGIPLLKMPGHTGYLTFATLPPHLNRELVLANCLGNKSKYLLNE